MAPTSPSRVGPGSLGGAFTLRPSLLCFAVTIAIALFLVSHSNSYGKRSINITLTDTGLTFGSDGLAFKAPSSLRRGLDKEAEERERVERPRGRVLSVR